MGNSLMNMLKSPDGRTVRLGSSSGHATPQRHHTMLPFSGGPVFNGASPMIRPSADQELERKIVPHAERQTIGWRAQDNPSRATSSKDRSTKSLSVGSPSLNPPPRKRWTAGAMNPPETITDHARLYHHVNGNSSVAGSFGLGGFRLRIDRVLKSCLILVLLSVDTHWVLPSRDSGPHLSNPFQPSPLPVKLA
ncbi:hypothetical protein PTI98_010995 [Pleurotus ostreatus]|nr:hypothetical protein PTI98_010995 [Pleurotus ostreatus]